MEFTENGILIKTIEEITSDNTDLWSEKTGDFDVSPKSAGGELIAIKSESDTRVEQYIAEAYTQNTILASGNYLDKVGQRQGKYRRTNVPTVAIVTITGASGTSIPEGTTFKCSTNNEIFESQYGVVIPVAGEVQVTVQSQNYGVICPANTLSLSPTIAGLSADNTSAGIVGFESETDAAFRVRLDTPSTTKTNSKDGLWLALLNVAGVAKNRVIDNNTDALLYGVIPARYFACVLYGGNTTEIAETIFTFMQNGNPSYGDVSQIVKSQRGELYGVSFTRAVELPVTVAVTITTDGTYDPDTDDDIIKQNIIAEFEALDIGEVVILDKIKSLCWIDGVLSVAVLLNGLASNVTVDWFKLATTNATEITVS